MVAYDRYPTSHRPVYVYVAVLLVAMVIIAGASAIWLSTDNSGTNFLATDPQSTSPPSPSAAP
jgi:uncharacterized membrane protein YhhN